MVAIRPRVDRENGRGALDRLGEALATLPHTPSTNLTSGPPSGVRVTVKMSLLCWETDDELHLSSQKGWVYPRSLRIWRSSSIAV